MGPYGPGGLEFMFLIATPKHTYMISIAPLSWGLGLGRTKLAVQACIGCIKVTVQHAVWDTDNAS